ncbi:hypothetical protein Dhaf_0298 [Desulfitobacterium hafniense DCB-2]|uniref:Dihydropyrimidinase n=1 Tax=Desulfitobacterium hafniense (strain DSM 10664 / DCB-2) TaxID=272564 RepID=B8G0U6_DESHD|nr:hypothetical protein [Desulfitobacterium hafniense]ACL18365.1 hypothetical protein Dhaf_0298 [Desulfitobacterium hafniense DCB-2]
MKTLIKNGTIITASEEQQQASDYTPYEGLRMKGRVAKVLLRGEVIVEEGKYVGKPGDGKFIARQTLRSQNSKV